ncbi:MAG TPA: CotH kinase family protein [Iamia sp.]
MRVTGALGALIVAAAALIAVPGSPAAAAPSIGTVTVGEVAAGEPTTITATVTAPDPAGVVLEVVVGFAPMTSIAMTDGGGGTYTADVPAQPADTLVRFRVRSGTVASPQTKNGRTYDGFVVAPTPVPSAVPVLGWFIAPDDYAWLRANPASKEYRPAVLVADGVVMDGVQVRPQGGGTAQEGPKPNFKAKLPKQLPLGPPYFAEPVDEVVLDADFEDPTYSVNVIGNEMYGRHGVPPRQVTTARIQRNGAFHGVYQLIEEMDGDWRDRAGFDVGAHYEGESTRSYLVDEGDTELLMERFSLEHPDDGDHTDLAALAAALDGVPSDARPAAIADAMDLPQLVDVLATSTILQNHDTLTGNWALLRDDDTGRWRAIPNDLDLVLGLRGRTRQSSLVPAFALGTTSPLFADERFVAMYLRRLRTLLDTELTAEGILGRLDENLADLAPELALDRETWPLTTPAPEVGRADVEDYVAFRRALLLAYAAAGDLPEAGPGDATTVVAEIRATGDPAGDFVALANPSTVAAADVSGWSLEGAAVATLPPGSVIPPGDEIVVPVDPAVMADRGEGVPVAGRLAGELPDGGGTVTVRDAEGTARDIVTWAHDGPWPSPGASGRSIEAETLGSGRSAGAQWSQSPEPGGTPGGPGPTSSPLAVDVWTGRATAPAGTPFEVRVTVRNRGGAALGGVSVTSSAPGCGRTVGSLAAGAALSWWCPVTLTGPRRSETIRVEGTANGSTVRDRSQIVVVDADGLVLGPPAAYEATMAPGGIGLAYEDPAPRPDGERAGPFHTWRMEAQAWPEDGADATTALVDTDGAVLDGLPNGVASSVRVVARSTVVLGQPTMRAPGIVPRPSVVWPFASAGALVAALYADLAGRPPTDAERAEWTSAIDQGTPPAALAVELLALPRWSGSAAAVARLYAATLGRAPDGPGLGYWIDRGATGTSLGAMAEHFVRSPEFRAVYGPLGDAAFVDRLYRNIFGRAPDAAGQAFWVARLQSGRSRGSVVAGFTQSPEGRALLAPATDVAVTWYALTGTAPPAAVRADAVAWLKAGGSRLTLVDSVRSRDAFEAAASL